MDHMQDFARLPRLQLNSKVGESSQASSRNKELIIFVFSKSLYKENYHLHPWGKSDKRKQKLKLPLIIIVLEQKGDNVH